MPTRFLLNTITLFSLLITINTQASAADLLEKTQKEAQRMHVEGKQSQAKIDATLDATHALLDEYRQLSKALEQVNINTQHAQQVHQQQSLTMASLQKQINQVDKTENAIIPMLVSMIDWLETHIHHDLPFNKEERLARIDQLKASLIDPKQSLTSRYRQVLDAYQIESEFGYTIESYQQAIPLNGQDRQVTILRIGRVGLYYQSLDGQTAGYWERQQQQWLAATKDTAREIHQGILIANKQRPQTLLALPVQATGAYLTNQEGQ